MCVMPNGQISNNNIFHSVPRHISGRENCSYIHTHTHTHTILINHNNNTFSTNAAISGDCGDNIPETSSGHREEKT